METLLEEIKVVFEKYKNTEKDLDVWTSSDSDTIIDHVISNYHRVSEEELKNLSPYVTKVSRVHGDNHPELLKVYELFYEFKKELNGAYGERRSSRVPTN